MRYLLLALLLTVPLTAQTAGEWTDVKSSDGSPLPRLELHPLAGEVYGTGTPAGHEKRFSYVWHLSAGVATPVLKPDESQLAYTSAITADNRALFVERTGMTSVQHVWVVVGSKATPLLDGAGAHMRVDGQAVTSVDNHEKPATIWGGGPLGGDVRWRPRQDACPYFIVTDHGQRSMTLWRINEDKASKVELPPKARGPSFAWTGKRLVMFAFRAAWFVDGEAPEAIMGADGNPLNPVFAGNIFATGDYLLHYLTWGGVIASLYRWKDDQLQEVPLPEGHIVEAVLDTGKRPYLLLNDGMRNYLYEFDGTKVVESKAIKLNENLVMGRVVSCGGTFVVQVQSTSAHVSVWHVLGGSEPAKIKFPSALKVPSVEAAFQGKDATVVHVTGQESAAVCLLDASGGMVPLEKFASARLAYVFARFARDGTYLTAMVNNETILYFQPSK